MRVSPIDKEEHVVPLLRHMLIVLAEAHTLLPDVYLTLSATRRCTVTRGWEDVQPGDCVRTRVDFISRIWTFLCSGKAQHSRSLSCQDDAKDRDHSHTRQGCRHREGIAPPRPSLNPCTWRYHTIRSQFNSR